ncbi:hypothetical protein [uncultured Litoreibacter sp.]|uniref:hypothetical protein n=1 Tax=uncultured Litoreibacter sp. TaxID=1392394 RepID=UPI002623EEF6|nr:hypothetical protein [uncultured Litoreibacter sp.]
MTRKIVWIVTSALVVSAGIFWKYGPAWQNPRPATLSLNVTNHIAVPIIRGVELNGFTFSRIRASNIGDTGGTPYKSRWSNDLDFTLVWIEMISKQAWRANFSVPIERLTTFGEDERHAQIELKILAGGDFSIETPQVEYARLIGLNRTGEVTDDMVQDIVLESSCADRLDDDDPVRLELLAGFEDWSVEGKLKGRATWIQRKLPLPSSRCTPDWTVEGE